LLAFAAQRLPTYLLRQRWYPAKDAGPPAVRLAALLPLDVPELSAAIAIWIAEPPGRAALRLFLPLALVSAAEIGESHPAEIGRRPDDAMVLADAFAVDAFVRAFVRLIVQADAVAPAPLHPARTTHVEVTALGKVVATIRRGTAEQSNTSIRIGEGAILKVIRKLEEGVHPELEMGRFLTARSSFRAAPALLGWIDLDGTTLAILQAFVPNDGDGWSWVLGQLRRGSREDTARCLAWIRRLGAATAELHRALATSTGDAAFDPEPATFAYWERWIQDVDALARRVCESLRRSRSDLDSDAVRIADAVLQRCAGLADALGGLLPPRASVARTRHHGDYHLGQILVRGEEAVIVDFEGEPMRPLEERRAKHVPLRDVAGMLRSFAYAAAVIERERAVASPASSDAVAAHRRQWLRDAADAFLGSYFANTAAGVVTASGRAETLRLVRLFELEKALYEVSYELANRPAWVAIPLASVLSLVDAALPQRRAHRMPYGAELLAGGGVRFRFWAPAHAQIHLVLGDGDGDQILPMTGVGEGWHELTLAGGQAGLRYRFSLPDGMRVPDPASRFQPDDVHGPSEVIDPAQYEWQDGAWTGRPWHAAVLYELHVGTFTAAGTFRAAIERLDHLSALGVTALEIMPVGDFPGARNWGYDGVLPYAPDSCYGRPDDFKALVDAAHARGVMVLLDVVYNHFGPDGNYLPAYAPDFFTERHHTPWGAAINYDGANSRWVREFVIHNALYWIEEYNLDGLRLDAVHAILDDGPRHVLAELAERVRALRPHAHLVLENEENQVTWLARDAHGRPLRYSAQWNDDVHHVLHAAATGEDSGYYGEYLGDTEKLGRALAEGFAFQGETMAFRGTPRGEPCTSLPPDAFVAFAQNHDQIGNRAFGDRLTAIAPAEAVRAIAAVYLLLPQVPMLFMGEEWAASQPFPFFCDFAGELADAVRQGRRAEFAKFPQFRDETTRARIPDPQADATFGSAKLQWSDVMKPGHAAWHELYRRLLEVRRETLLPLQPLLRQAATYAALGRLAVLVRWRTDQGDELTLAANLSAARTGGCPPAAGRILWQEGTLTDAGCDPWSVRWSLATRGGGG
jgi:malto-oligosyltrehalose trehalohydrolase